MSLPLDEAGNYCAGIASELDHVVSLWLWSIGAALVWAVMVDMAATKADDGRCVCIKGPVQSARRKH